MCSYNRVNQTYACESEHMLKDILRDELGFKGYVVSDWFATHSTSNAANAGLDMEMPGHLASRPQNPAYFGSKVGDAIKKGEIPETRLDDMVRNIMAPYYYLGQDSPGFPTVDPAGRFGVIATQFGIPQAIASGLITKGTTEFPRGRDNRKNHAKLIREMGSAGTVLLKNANNTLPVKTPTVIGVFGNDAADFTTSFFRRTAPPNDARVRESDTEFLYITDNNILAANVFNSVYPPPELCFVFQQTFASEGFDRTDFELDGNSTLVINNVANYCAKTVVITHYGGVNTMPWADYPKIGAILAAHYPGQETGNSIVDLLWGDMAPSGRLPYTIPREAEDAGPSIVNLTSSLSARPDSEKEILPGGNPDLWEQAVVVSATISNTGDRAAHAVPQLYLSFPAGTPEGTPVKVLRGLEKILIESGGQADVDFPLMRRDVSYWDSDLGDWVIPQGEFAFRVGFSSRDLPAQTKFSVLK
ncbi:hypothetical protein ACHAQH_008240 [Verticillium albo-atrum]